MKKLLKILNQPTGFTIEWWSGGFRFTPPLYAWLLLEVVLVAAFYILETKL